MPRFDGFVEGPAAAGGWWIRMADNPSRGEYELRVDLSAFAPESRPLVREGAVLAWHGWQLHVVTEPRWSAEMQSEAEAFADRMAPLVRRV